MCGRLACTLHPEHLEGACSYLDDELKWTKPQWIKNKLDYKPFYNGAPTTTVPVLAHRSHFSNIDSDCTEYVLVPMRWSMTPNWQSSSKSSYHTHNARVESLMTSPLYKTNISEGRRCVIIADGYYEWQTTQGNTKRQPYFLYKEPWVHSDSSEAHWDKYTGWSGKYLMKLAGVFNIIKEDDGYSYTCAVLTAEANSSLAWLHHRMPIFCDYDYYIQKWITKKHLNADKITQYLCGICNSESPNLLSLKYHPVNPAYVNNSSCNDPKCMEAVSSNKNKTLLDSWFGKKSAGDDKI